MYLGAVVMVAIAPDEAETAATKKVQNDSTHVFSWIFDCERIGNVPDRSFSEKENRVTEGSVALSRRIGVSPKIRSRAPRLRPVDEYEVTLQLVFGVRVLTWLTGGRTSQSRCYN